MKFGEIQKQRNEKENKGNTKRIRGIQGEQKNDKENKGERGLYFHVRSIPKLPHSPYLVRRKT